MSKDNGGPASDKIQQARRAAFEAWTKSEHGNISRRQDGEYFDDLTHGAWLGFNAALDCVVIELPTRIASMFVTSREAIAAQAGVIMCADAIESTNLGIKVK